MALSVVLMMKSDVVPVEDATYSVVAKAVMEQGLADRYHQMGTDSSQNEQRKRGQEPSCPFDHQRCGFLQQTVATFDRTEAMVRQPVLGRSAEKGEIIDRLRERERVTIASQTTG